MITVPPQPKGHPRSLLTMQKSSTERVAVASGRVLLGQTAFDLVVANAVKKGDVLTVAQVAGIMGAKQTAQLVSGLTMTLTLSSRSAADVDVASYYRTRQRS